MLTTYKLTTLQPADCERLVTSAKVVADAAERRRLRRAGPSRRYPGNQAQQFDPHVLLELDGLRDAISQIADPLSKTGLLLVLSSMANKVSRQASDTARGTSPRRWASGFAIQFFCKKAQELARRQSEFRQRLESCPVVDIDVRLGDARKLPFRDGTFAAVVTSPPYPGVYDYVEHHRLRLQWLGLPVHFLQRHEIGARRLTRGARAVRDTYNAQLSSCLSEMSRVLRPGGTVALVVADTVVDSSAWYADEEIERIAHAVGLSVAAAAAQPRPHFHKPSAKAFGRRPRSERVLLLRRTTRESTPR
jgi:SAM-dependent methyltransferase